MRNSLIYLLIAVAAIALILLLFRQGDNAQTVPFNRVVEMARDNTGPALNIEVNGDTVKIDNGSQVFSSRKETSTSVFEALTDAGADLNNYRLDVRGQSGLATLLQALIGFLPLILFAGLLIFMLRQAQAGNSQTMNFGRTRARMFVGAKATVTFFDVAGVPEAKEELEEIVEFLKFPERFQALGARIPRGVLLVGPPGTGKTLLARAVAGEAGVPFFSISGSEFVEMFVGVGASRVRDLFQQAKRHAPCIIFVDEIDAVGRHRGAGLGGGHDEREQTLNQILVEMDGFDTNSSVIVIAATNRPDILDPALLRPGRFDRRVTLDTPDIRGRTAILDVHAKGKPFDKGIEMQAVAKQTPGFSGADLANLINEAALLAARKNKKSIGLDELLESIDRVSIGPARKSKVITEDERRLTAYHEAGTRRRPLLHARRRPRRQNFDHCPGSRWRLHTLGARGQVLSHQALPVVTHRRCNGRSRRRRAKTRQDYHRSITRFRTGHAHRERDDHAIRHERRVDVSIVRQTPRGDIPRSRNLGRTRLQPEDRSDHRPRDRSAPQRRRADRHEDPRRARRPAGSGL